MSDVDVRDTITNIPGPVRGTSDALHVDASPPLVVVGAGNDSTVWSPPLVGIRNGAVVSDITVVSNGTSILLASVQIGEVIPGEIQKVMATGTDATDITGWQRRL
jgi:hypothetical protein